MIKWLRFSFISQLQLNPGIYLFLLPLLAPALTANAVHAQELQLERLDITDFGTYALDREINGRNSQGISIGNATNVQHMATERTVPAQIGITFGFRYKVLGKLEGAIVPLKKTIVFPAPGLQTPLSARLRKAEFKFEARIGEMNTELYTLEDEFELVPGTWVLETWLGNRKLASQPFKLVRQPETLRIEKLDQSARQARKPELERPNGGCVRSCDGL